MNINNICTKQGKLFISFIFSFLFWLQIHSQFTDVGATAGVEFEHDGDMNNDFGFGSGCAWLDYDNDDDLDLYVTMREGANRLYRNEGNASFTLVADALGAADASGDGGGVAVADFNNDGWVDIFLANCDGDHLFKNNNGTSFTDITFTAGIAISGLAKGTTASWGDYDDDGYLDLYVANHLPVNGVTATCQDYLFYNNGNETFTDVSSLLGLTNIDGEGFIGGWTDYDKDGDLDIYLINDCSSPVAVPNFNKLHKVFRNDGGIDPLTWTFTETSSAINADLCENGMGLAVGDINHDGWLDYSFSNIGPAVLLKNTNGSFTDISASSGMNNQAAGIFTWGTSFFDYDLDGWQDLLIMAGHLTIPSFVLPHPNYFYKNNGNETFTEVSIAQNMADSTKSRNGIVGDYDNDGDLDVFILNYGEHTMLKRNDNNTGNNYIKLDLEGDTSNKDGIGAFIKLTTPDGMIQYLETRSGSNLGGGEPGYAHFGLGVNATITEIEITWPSGIIQTITNPAINQKLDIMEPAAILPVELDDFQAIAQDRTVLLKWTTASEVNNDYFEVQRSKDGNQFENLGKIEGQVFSHSKKDYQFIDNQPFEGKNYYRLKQVDLDGSSSFSAVKVVYFENKMPSVQVFPNPVNEGILNISLSNFQGEISLELLNAFGGSVFIQEWGSIFSKEAEISISVENVESGIYFLKISSQNEQVLERVVIE